MNIKVEKKDKQITLLCFAFLFVIGCGTDGGKAEQSLGISVTLKRVLSNYPLHEVDTINPLPEIVFILSFKNDSKRDYILNFQDYMTGKDSNLRVKIQCSNGRLATLPLFQNTGNRSFLKKQDEIILSFKAISNDILSELKKCGEGYLGRIIEKETKKLSVLYETKSLSFQSDCIRQEFESPEYFLME